MGKPTGFIELKRKGAPKRDVKSRIHDSHDVYERPDETLIRDQASRCMDCGIPFCHQGCPLGNRIPDWNDLVYRGRYAEALEQLHATNNFPEFTGKLCPAPCEAACVVGLVGDAVTIKNVELEIIERGFDASLVVPEIAVAKTGKRVAVVGSGPAGLACAQQLARAGHDVLVFEKSDRVGGLLRYGIPDFKMDKSWLDRRLQQLRAEGVEFRGGVDVGVDISAETLLADFDAICLASGAGAARALDVPGADANGIHFAMEYLEIQNRVIARDAATSRINAYGKHVVILGGGDTGADCLGTAHRQGAKSVTQLEIAERPPEARDAHRDPWPMWPTIFRVSPAHEEGGVREFSAMTTQIHHENGQIRKVEMVRVERDASGKWVPVPNSTRVLECDLLLLAMGFVGPVAAPLYAELGVQRDATGRVIADENGRTNIPSIFAGGDVRRGASLIVWAIAEGRKMAASANAYLTDSR